MLLDSIWQLVYYYRGALQYNEAMFMSPMERESAVEFINKRMKEAGDMMKKGHTPFL